MAETRRQNNRTDFMVIFVIITNHLLETAREPLLVDRPVRIRFQNLISWALDEVENFIDGLLLEIFTLRTEGYE